MNDLDRSPELQARMSACADRMIQDVLWEHAEAFIRAYNAEMERQAQEQFERLCHFTYHLLGLRDADDVDWDENLRRWQDKLRAEAAERYAMEPGLLDLPDDLL